MGTLDKFVKRNFLSAQQGQPKISAVSHNLVALISGNHHCLQKNPHFPCALDTEKSNVRLSPTETNEVDLHSAPLHLHHMVLFHYYI